MIRRMWKVPWAMWLHQNKVVYSIQGIRRAETVVEMEVCKLHAEGAPARMEGRFWAHWSKPLNNILTWEQHRKMTWIEMARLILEKGLTIK